MKAHLVLAYQATPIKSLSGLIDVLSRQYLADMIDYPPGGTRATMIVAL